MSGVPTPLHSGEKEQSARFFERLEARVQQVDSLLCVGLDPHAKELEGFEGGASAASAYEFCARLIESTKEIAAAYKPNVAFFEHFGVEGVRVLERVLALIPADIPVVLDAKRGDIG